MFAKTSAQIFWALCLSVGLAISSPTYAQNDGKTHFEAESVVTITAGPWELIGDLHIAPVDAESPAVLLLHTLWGGNREHVKPLARALAKRGISSLSLDLRGHGESINVRPVLPRPEIDLEIFFESWSDIVAAHDFLSAHPLIDSSRIGIMGASYSGEIAARAAEETRFANAYVMLAPATMSPEAIVRFQAANLPWIYVLAEDDHTFAKNTAILVERRGGTVWRYEDGGHATAILTNRPDAVEDIADWFVEALKK